VRYRIAFKHTQSLKSLSHSVHATTIEDPNPIRDDDDFKRIEKQIRRKLLWIEDQHQIEILGFSRFDV
jgi:hypothetical protein